MRLAQHTVDCSGDAEAARQSWSSQGTAWFPLPAGEWRLAPAEPGNPSWTWTCERWGAQLRLIQLVEPGPHGSRIHARAEVEGPLAWLHRLRLQPDLRARLPEALRAVARRLALASQA